MILAKIITVNVKTNQMSTLWLNPSIIIPSTKTATPDKNATRPATVRCNCSRSSRAFSFQTKAVNKINATTNPNISNITIGLGINQLNGLSNNPTKRIKTKAVIISLAKALFFITLEIGRGQHRYPYVIYKIFQHKIVC